MTTQIYQQLKGLIVEFLRDLASAFEEGRLSKSQQEVISNIFLKFIFQNPQGLGPTVVGGTRNRGEPAENDLLQFLSLGWFIYTKLLHPSG